MEFRYPGRTVGVLDLTAESVIVWDAPRGRVRGVPSLGFAVVGVDGASSLIKGPFEIGLVDVPSSVSSSRWKSERDGLANDGLSCMASLTLSSTASVFCMKVRTQPYRRPETHGEHSSRYQRQAFQLAPRRLCWRICIRASIPPLWRGRRRRCT
jgi:hypothetical protein